MAEQTVEKYESHEQGIKILVDTLRQCFGAEKARYYIADHQDKLFIEIEGLETLSENEITDIATPVLDELDLDFNEISLLPLSR